MTTRVFASRRLLAVLTMLAIPAVALAYIDPGSGSYMLQVILTVAATGFFYLRHPVRLFQLAWRWLSSRRRQADTPSP